MLSVLWGKIILKSVPKNRPKLQPPFFQTLMRFVAYFFVFPPGALPPASRSQPGVSISGPVSLNAFMTFRKTTTNQVTPNFVRFTIQRPVKGIIGIIGIIDNFKTLMKNTNANLKFRCFMTSQRAGGYLETFLEPVAPLWLSISPWRAMATPFMPKIMESGVPIAVQGHNRIIG